MEYDLQLIGARLQAARKAKGYTQDYVSARADITEKFLSQIERGKAGLSVQTLIALCDILEITPNYVLLPDAARVLEEPIGSFRTWRRWCAFLCATAATRKRAGPGAGAETCGERPPGRNEARAGSALAALALRAFAQNRARRFAARNDPVRFVRFAAMASPPRTALLPSPSRLRRAGSPTAKPRRLLPFGCISPAAKPRGRYFRTFARHDCKSAGFSL